MRALLQKEFQLQKIMLKSSQGKMFMALAIGFPIINGSSFLGYFMAIWMFANVLAMYQVEVKENINKLFLSFPCTRETLVRSKLIFAIIALVEGLIIGLTINVLCLALKLPIKSMEALSFTNIKIAVVSAVVLVCILSIISMLVGYKYVSIVFMIPSFFYCLFAIDSIFPVSEFEFIKIFTINTLASNMLMICACAVMLFSSYVLSVAIYKRRDL